MDSRPQPSANKQFSPKPRTPDGWDVNADPFQKGKVIRLSDGRCYRVEGSGKRGGWRRFKELEDYLQKKRDPGSRTPPTVEGL